MDLLTSYFSPFFQPPSSLPGPHKVSIYDLETPPPTSQSSPPSVLIRLFYPSTTSTPFTRWLPNPILYTSGYGQFLNLPSPIYFPFMLPFAYTLTSPTSQNAPIYTPPLRPSFPVIIFSHGLGGMRTAYSHICMNLASHGYVVAAIEHRDGSAAIASVDAYKNSIAYRRPTEERRELQGREKEEYVLEVRKSQLEVRHREVMEVVTVLKEVNGGGTVGNLMDEFGEGFRMEEFKERLDLNKLVIAGHSFGGATAIKALQDPKTPFVAGVVFDPWMHAVSDKLTTRPFITIQSETFHWKDNLDAIRHHLPEIPITPSPSQFILLRHTAHQDFSDFPYLFPRLTRYAKIGGNADPKRVFALIDSLTIKFLNQVCGWKEKEEMEEKEKEEEEKLGEHLYVEGEKAFKILYDRLI